MPIVASELIKKAKKIEIATRRLVEETLAGQYHSVFKGRGLVFSDVRPYYEGDDVRSIDWNVSARMNAAHVKQFVEERDRTVNLVIDMSASGLFGSAGSSKRELAAELAAMVAFSAIRNNDRVGLFLLTDKVERYLPPKKGKRHVMRVVSEILSFQPTSRATDLAFGLDFLAKIARRRSVVFLVSDFLSDGWERALKLTAQRHDLVPVVVSDPVELAMPEIGLCAFEDLETGEVVEFDTSGWNVLGYRRQLEADAAARDAALRRLSVETVLVRTDQPYVDALVAFFKARARRLAHA
ncbi:MAG TPA: DUF58 domain-containing protein [Kofleriaceae bacterium]|nr:DUF58 domain-containing protein [Kofleriaceae bacterium]